MTAAVLNRSETHVRKRILVTAEQLFREIGNTIADDHVRLSRRGCYRSLRSSVLSVDDANSRNFNSPDVSRRLSASRANSKESAMKAKVTLCATKAAVATVKTDTRQRCEHALKMLLTQHGDPFIK